MALDALKPTPEEFRDMRIDRDEALEVLRCGGEVLDLLVQDGLANRTSGGLERFDFHDLANVALYSGSRQSLPETAERFLLRFAEGSPSQWTAGKRWDVTWSLRCGRPHCDHGSWLISLPALGPRSAQDATLADADHREQLHHEGGAVELRFVAEVVGSQQAVVAAGIRDLFNQLVDELRTGTFRYQWMPQAMRTNVDAATAYGTLDCAAACLLLARRCRSSGYNAHTRIGVVLGLVGVEHVVTEVLDADGTWKTLDPVFAFLAGRSDRITPGFAEFCAGSVGNRMLTWGLPATASLASHTCGGSAPPHLSEITASVTRRAA